MNNCVMLWNFFIIKEMYSNNIYYNGKIFNMMVNIHKYTNKVQYFYAEYIHIKTNV